VQKNSIYATTIDRYYISFVIMTRLVRLYMFCISDISEAGKKIACKERWLFIKLWYSVKRSTTRRSICVTVLLIIYFTSGHF